MQLKERELLNNLPIDFALRIDGNKYKENII